MLIALPFVVLGIIFTGVITGIIVEYIISKKNEKKMEDQEISDIDKPLTDFHSNMENIKSGLSALEIVSLSLEILGKNAERATRILKK